MLICFAFYITLRPCQPLNDPEDHRLQLNAHAGYNAAVSWLATKAILEWLGGFGNTDIKDAFVMHVGVPQPMADPVMEATRAGHVAAFMDRLRSALGRASDIQPPTTTSSFTGRQTAMRGAVVGRRRAISAVDAA